MSLYRMAYLANHGRQENEDQQTINILQKLGFKI